MWLMAKTKWITGGFVLLMIVIIMIANLGLSPRFFPFLHKIPGLDKAGHFLLMGLLSFFVNMVFQASRTKIFSLNALKGNLLVFLIVALEEFSQIFLVHREFSLVDLLFDLAGIILFGRLAAWWINRKHNQIMPNSESE